MAYNQSKNPFSKNPLNFNSPLNSFDSLVGKLMNQGKSKEAATKIAGKVANAKLKGAGKGPTAAQKARMKGSPADLKSPIDKELVGNQHRLPEELKAKIEAAPESPAKMKSPMKKHGDKFRKRAMKLSEKSEQGDYDYDNPKVVELLDKAKEADKKHEGSPAKKEGMFSKAIEDKSLLKEKPATVESASKAVKDFGKKVADQKAKNDKKPATAKSKSVVSSEGRDGSNRQERKKRRQERRSIRKNKDLSASQKRMAIKESRKQQKDNVRGVKKDSPASMKSPMKKGKAKYGRTTLQGTAAGLKKKKSIISPSSGTPSPYEQEMQREKDLKALAKAKKEHAQAKAFGLSMKSPMKKDGERAESLIPVSSVISKGSKAVKKGAKKFLDAHLLNPKNINKGRKFVSEVLTPQNIDKGRKAINTGIKKAVKKGKKLAEGVVEFAKDTQKRAT